MAKLVTRRQVDLGHAPNLRACLEQDAECVNLMAEVDALCTNLMYAPELRSRFGIYERFEVFVTPQYAQTVEDNLDQILYGCCDVRNLTMPDGSFLPSPQDALMLLTANRIRCLGLLWGLFPEEREGGSRDFQNSKPISPLWEVRNPGERATTDCDVLRDWLGQFAARASRYVIDNWRLNCSWTEPWRFVLAQIISASLPLGKFTPAPVNEVSEEVVGFKVKKMAYVLRLASICGVGKDACPPEVRLRLYPGEFVDSQKSHLSVVEWINDYGFDHGRRLIEFQALVPPVLEVPSPGSDEKKLPVAHVDFQSEVEFFGATLQGFLDEISAYLSECSNTAFQTISVRCQRAQAFQAENVIRYKLPEHWSLAVAGASNASESAAMVALVLSSFCHDWIESGQSGKSDIPLAQTVNEVLTGSRYLHPFNSLIAQLANDYGAVVDSWVGKPSGAQVSKFREMLDSYLVAREYFGNSIAEKIRDEGVMADVDCVILYGYGRTALSSLIWSSFSGRVLLVRAPEEQGAPWCTDETNRVIQLLDGHQIAYSESSVAEVPSRLGQLSAQGKKFLFLSGCLAVLETVPEQRQFICSVGTRSIATAVHDMDGEVFVVSDYDKLIVRSDNKAMMDEIVSALEERKIHPGEFRKWEFVDTLENAKHVDRSYTAVVETESEGPDRRSCLE